MVHARSAPDRGRQRVRSERGDKNAIRILGDPVLLPDGARTHGPCADGITACHACGLRVKALDLN
jgi:hypothetical protein